MDVIDVDVDSLDFCEGYFTSASELLNDFWWLLSFKWPEVLIDNVAERIPPSWIEFLAQLTSEEVVELLSNYCIKTKEAPADLTIFLQRCASLSARLRWPDRGTEFKRTGGVRRNKRISDKKVAEVESLLNIILEVTRAELQLEPEQVTVLDIGAGLGYISEKLCERGYKIIGVEAQSKLCDKANMKFLDHNITFVQMKIENTVECHSKIAEMLKDEPNVLVIGLHCCGDLLRTIHQLYACFAQIKSSVCVTCCYHLIDVDRFPRSKTFANVARQHSFQFSSTVLRVGTYDPPQRWCLDMSGEKLEAHTRTAFYRAVFEQYVSIGNVAYTRPVKKKLHSKMDGTFSGFVDSIKSGFEST